MNTIRMLAVGVCLTLLLSACGTSQPYDRDDWEPVRLYDGEKKPLEDIAALLVPMPLYISTVAAGTNQPWIVDRIADKERAIELLPTNYTVKVHYREHNVNKEATVIGDPQRMSFRAHTGEVYRVVLLRKFERETDRERRKRDKKKTKREKERDLMVKMDPAARERQWSAAIRDERTELIVSTPIMPQDSANAAAADALEKIRKRVNLQIITNKQGRVEFRAVKQ